MISFLLFVFHMRSLQMSEKIKSCSFDLGLERSDVHAHAALQVCSEDKIWARADDVII